MNVSVVVGEVANEPDARVLKSGEEMMSFDVTVRSEGRPTETVPVVWCSPPASAASLAAEQRVVVTGRVRRRFFRAGGVTASRTEVVAAEVIPVRRKAKVAAAVDAAIASLADI